MLKIIKLHQGLFNYLCIELKKTRTPKELVYFLLNTAKIYFKQSIQIYKEAFLIFDKDYIAKKKEFEKFQKAKKEITGLIKLLRYSKDKLRKSGLSRQRVKRFFIDLGSRDDDALQKLCDDLTKEIEGVK